MVFPHESGVRLTDEAEARSLIERFTDKVSRSLYSRLLHPTGQPEGSAQSALVRYLGREFEELEEKLGPGISGVLFLPHAPLTWSLFR